MRCGKKTEGKDVFCPECLAEMEKYPVKPGTVIHIPVRQMKENRKNARRKKEHSLEEQLVNARSLVRTLTACVLGLFGALILTGTMLIFVMTQSQEEAPETPMTRNYTTITADGE